MNSKEFSIECNHLNQLFKGKIDFMKRLLKKHLMTTFCLSEQQANQKIISYEEIDLNIFIQEEITKITMYVIIQK